MLAEATKTAETLADKGSDKVQKVKMLGEELRDVQELLSETESKHKELSDKLDQMRQEAKEAGGKQSDTKLDNDKMREDLKANNRKLAAKQTDLIGRRHQV